jgi:hypothetical protein
MRGKKSTARQSKIRIALDGLLLVGWLVGWFVGLQVLISITIGYRTNLSLAYIVYGLS